MKINPELKKIKASVANLYQENGCTIIFVDTPTTGAKVKGQVYFLNNFLFFKNRPVQKAKDSEIARLLYAMILKQGELMKAPLEKIIKANFIFMLKEMPSATPLFHLGKHLDISGIRANHLKLNKKSKLPVNNLLNANIENVLTKLSQLKKQGTIKNYSLYSLQDESKVRLGLYGNSQNFAEQASINSCLALDYCASFMAFNLADFFKDLLKTYSN